MKYLLTLFAAALLLAGCGSSGNVSSGNSPRSKHDGYTDNNTSAISHVEVTETDSMVYNTFEEYLEGRVPGVQIGPDGGIVIRGNGTFNGSSAPLILLDGVEVLDTGAINPSDIYSVDVLKDAGSTAIYGMRGANGVILVTTKGAQAVKEAERREKAEKRKKK
jgi:TonB-dependent SusC/RagA subfamily outer membrane receptor